MTLLRSAAQVATIFLMMTPPLRAERLDQLELSRYPRIREAERYQLKVAEQLYDKQDWKAAADEYEKFVTLYERSEVASYCQMKWAICQVNLKKLNTAIKEGFQTVIDYWPDSPDAVASAYYIAHTYRSMGEIKKAKAAYKDVLHKYETKHASAYAARDLAEIARTEMDADTQLSMWKRLTFDTKRDEPNVNSICINASRELAAEEFGRGVFDEGVRALATTYGPADLPQQTLQLVLGPLRSLESDAKTKAQAEKLGDRAIAWMKEQAPQDITEPAKKDAARRCWYAVADLEAALNRKPQVAQTYEQILKQFGASDETLLRLGDWQKSINDYEAARATYGRFENKIDGKYQIAHSFRQQKNFEQSARAFRQLSLEDEKQPFRWIGEEGATWRYYAQNYGEAIKVYTELVQKDVERLDDWLFALADAYHHAGQYKEAIQFYRQCGKHFPDTHFRMAACHRALKEYNEALLVYGGIIRTDKNAAPSAQLESARTFEEQGLKEKAILAFQKVCKEYPASGPASTAHAHLQTNYKITVTLGGAKKD
jgi:tetratricopeptide (TPR) repeat protein